MRFALSFKHGIDLRDISPEILMGHSVVVEQYRNHDLPCRVTSGQDGKHSDRSFHYPRNDPDHGPWCEPKFKALDYGTKNPSTGEQWSSIIKNALSDDIRRALGPQFQVVVEADHIHVEFDPV